MQPDLQRVDSLLRFALLAAGEADDYRERQLGPIHLIKYAYLADLAFAKRHEGQSYTGVPWQFYNFGPWSPAVFERVEPALSSVGATKVSLPSDYGDRGEWVRWSLRRDDLVSELERVLPSEIVLAIRTCVKRFGADTPVLLDHVYRTYPMLNAVPGELLNLSFASGSLQPRLVRVEGSASGAVSVKKLKKVKERFAALRSKAASEGRQGPALVNPVPNARFDDVYFGGLEWMDTIAGEQLPEGDTALEFGADVWKSPTRTEHDPS